MNKTITDVKTVELLPPMLARDARVCAVADTFDDKIKEIQELQPLAVLYGNIDILPESILQYLAVEHNVYGAEWLISETLIAKRELIKSSYVLNKLAGTRWAIERVFAIVGLQADIVEWQDDPTRLLNPFEFKVNVIDVAGGGVDRDKLEHIIALIGKYKPVSRHLMDIKVVSAVQPVKINAKIGVYFKVKIYV